MQAHLFFIFSFVIYLLTFLGHLTSLILNRPHWQSLALKGILFGFVVNAIGLVIELVHTGDFLLTSTSHTYAFLSILIVLFHLLLSVRYRVNFLALFSMPLVLFLMLASHLATGGDEGRELLIGYWLKLHVVLTFIAYSAFASACVTGLGYLIQDKQLKSHHPGKMFQWIPPLGTLDEINTRSLIVGILLLTLGLLSGFFWAKTSGGVFWVNDPKVLCAIAIWCLYSFLILLRVTSRVRGRKVAVVSVFGFALVILSFIGVNHTVIN